MKYLPALCLCYTALWCSCNGSSDGAAGDVLFAKGASLSEGEARVLATRLANRKARGLMLTDEQGKSINIPDVSYSSWLNVIEEKERWNLSITPPAGLSWHVSFNLDGSEPKVSIAYSSD